MRKRKPIRKKKPIRKRKPSRPKLAIKRKAAKRKKRARGSAQPISEVRIERQGLGPNAAGQAGDIQGVPGSPRANSESVEDLLEEGQTLEAGVVSGVENARDPDEGEVKTHEVPEDDVPPEYDKDE